MKRLSIPLICLLATLTTACPKQPEPPKPPDEVPRLMEGQRAILEKAEQTEQVILETDEKRRKEMEEQGL